MGAADIYYAHKIMDKTVDSILIIFISMIGLALFLFFSFFISLYLHFDQKLFFEKILF